MSPAVIQRGMLSGQAAFSRHSMGKPHSRCSHAFSIIPVPTPAQRPALYAKSGQFGGETPQLKLSTSSIGVLTITNSHFLRVARRRRTFVKESIDNNGECEGYVCVAQQFPPHRC